MIDRSKPYFYATVLGKPSEDALHVAGSITSGLSIFTHTPQGAIKFELFQDSTGADIISISLENDLHPLEEIFKTTLTNQPTRQGKE